MRFKHGKAILSVYGFCETVWRCCQFLKFGTETGEVCAGMFVAQFLVVDMKFLKGIGGRLGKLGVTSTLKFTLYDQCFLPDEHWSLRAKTDYLFGTRVIAKYLLFAVVAPSIMSNLPINTTVQDFLFNKLENLPCYLKFLLMVSSNLIVADYIATRKYLFKKMRFLRAMSLFLLNLPFLYVCREIFGKIYFSTAVYWYLLMCLWVWSDGALPDSIRKLLPTPSTDDEKVGQKLKSMQQQLRSLFEPPGNNFPFPTLNTFDDDIFLNKVDLSILNGLRKDREAFLKTLKRLGDYSRLLGEALKKQTTPHFRQLDKINLNSQTVIAYQKPLWRIRRTLHV